MKGLLHLYGGALLLALRRAWRRKLRDVGEWMKRFGRKLVSLGEDSKPRWSIELFHRCYLADAEFHFGWKIFRGPMRAAFTNGDTLSFRMNWLANKTDPHGDWEYPHGTGVVKLKVKDHSPPYKLENGDIWFMFDGGHGILYLGNPRQNLEFKGHPSMLRWSTWF